jgi:hypothetical protein
MRKPSSQDTFFTSLLTTLFIGLKLTGQVNWSWWWVLSPLWIPLAFVLIFVALYFLFEAMGK